MQSQFVERICTSTQQMFNNLKAAYCWLRSFTKTDWQATDYPICLRKNELADDAHCWSAQIIKWWVQSGFGSSPDEAVSNLRMNLARTLARYRAEGRDIPRPGTHVPIEFAPSVRIKQHREILDEFIIHVLGFTPRDVLLTDGSSLFDFNPRSSLDELQKRIQDHFKIDVSDISDQKIVDILGRIAASRAP